MITDEQIQRAKLWRTKPSASRQPDNDNIRIAYEWLDAQLKIKVPLDKKLDFERIISDWGGRAISQQEIDFAAHMHSEIKGEYPFYSINPRLTFPSTERLRNRVKLQLRSYEEQHMLLNYGFYEIIEYASNDGRVLTRSFHCEPLPALHNYRNDYCADNDCECYYCVYGR